MCVCVCVCVFEREREMGSHLHFETIRKNEVNQGKHLKSINQRADDRTLRHTSVSAVNRGEGTLKNREK